MIDLGRETDVNPFCLVRNLQLENFVVLACV